jgi:hypothetical protein
MSAVGGDNDLRVGAEVYDRERRTASKVHVVGVAGRRVQNFGNDGDVVVSEATAVANAEE